MRETPKGNLNGGLDAVIALLEEPWIGMELRNALVEAKRWLEESLAILYGQSAA